MNRFFEPHPRLIKSNPWNTIDDSLGELIDKIILEFNPQVLDDDIPDTLDDFANRNEAIEYLLKKLLTMKGEL